MIRRLVTVLAAALLGALAAGGLASGTAPVVALGAVHTYAYDAPTDDPPACYAARERGPSADRNAAITYDAVDYKSHGALECSGRPTPRVATTYDDPAGLCRSRGLRVRRASPHSGSTETRDLFSARKARKGRWSGPNRGIQVLSCS